MTRRSTNTVLLSLGLAAAALASEVPVRNWPVPLGAFEAAGKAVDATPPRAFIGLPPCRIVDTRGNAAPIQGGMFTGPADVRTWALVGQCGIPAGADAVSLNFTVVAPSGSGFLTAWPAGSAVPRVSILNYSGGQTIANAAILPLGVGEAITVNVSAPAHVLLDVNGYFSDRLGTPSNAFELENNGASPTVNVRNLSPTCAGGCAVFAQAGTTQPNAAAIRGHASSVADTSYAGVLGTVASAGSGSAGVRGIGGDGSPVGGALPFVHAGVRGDSLNGFGVFGLSEAWGVIGISMVAGTSTINNSAILGYQGVSAGYGLYSQGNAHVVGTLTATNKMFVEPHPSDPAKEIQYISLEGRKAEIYFRGTARVAQGVTRIPIPEDFRMVARPDSYSTLVTPVGRMATVAVLSEGATGVVIEASRDVKVHYVVYAERGGVPEHQPVAENVHFRPDYEGPFGAALPAGYRETLVRTGVLKADGTANEEQARRLGWKLRPARENPLRVAP